MSKPLNYLRIKRDPVAERYERNGWIGLAITLAVCLLAFILFGWR